MSSHHSSFKPLTKEDVAENLQISVRTVENWINEGLLVRPSKIGARVYWRPDIYSQWLWDRLGEPDTQEANSLNHSLPKRQSRSAAEACADTLRSKTEKKLRELLADCN